MPLRYRFLARSVHRQSTRVVRRRCSNIFWLNHRSPSSFHRALHTTPSLQASALLQQDQEEDDEELQMFAASCMKEIFARENMAFCTLEDELGEASVWDKPIEEWEDELIIAEPEKKQVLTQDILERFDPVNPPETLEDLELWLECESQQESVLKYQQALESARERQDYTSLGFVQKLVLEWYQPLKDAIEKEQLRFLSSSFKKLSNRYGPHLCILPAEKLTVIVAHEAMMQCLTSKKRVKGEGVSLATVALQIGRTVEAEVNMSRILQKRAMEQRAKRKGERGDGFTDAMREFVEDEYAGETAGDDGNNHTLDGPNHWMYQSHHLDRFSEDIIKIDHNARKRIRNANKKARALLQNDDPWTSQDHVKLGVALLEIVFDTATIRSVDGKLEKAFKYHKLWHDRKWASFITIHDSIYKMAKEEAFQSMSAFSSRHKPMVVPPDPWTSPNCGGYKWLQAPIMRTGESMLQKEALFEADLSTVFDGLNVLGNVPWKINKTVLEVAQQCWNSGISIGDIPSRVDFEVPSAPIRPERIADSDFADRDSDAYKMSLKRFLSYKEAQAKHDRFKQKNMDLRSLRCSALLKLDQAEKFQDFEEIYFPYNLDFRGRVYPIPPHLSNVGSDMSRGLLKFAKGKALGSRGLYWLQVHLANLAGNDKITFDDRAKFTQDHMEDVRAAVNDPFGENRWWMTLDDPFQGLATCHEIINAIDSGSPETYECSLPVHMDGSCNGLQHYAALGRDKAGGKAVNLCREDKPQDVYSGVMEEVIRRVALDAAVELSFDESKDGLSKEERKALRQSRGAKLVNGLIDRGVVKRTVMTSVYGVTFVGARTQIQEKIEEKLEAQGLDVDELEDDIYSACNYLASLTMEVMGQLFSGARQTMNWLTVCARLIAQQDQPVSWISPIGVPVIQPYRKTKPHTIVTLLQRVVLTDRSDDLPIHKAKQVSAFPPNFVHSLDSSHMILTAMEMDRRGLVFSAVHDSFWTHPCDIDELNEALRDCFVELYEQPLLERLKAMWELRYPTIQFPDLPERGDLDLNDVRSAPYFFQ